MPKWNHLHCKYFFVLYFLLLGDRAPSRMQANFARNERASLSTPFLKFITLSLNIHTYDMMQSRVVQ